MAPETALTPEVLAAFAARTRGRRLAGLDLGTRTIGLAVSDPGQRVASPVETIRRTRFTPDAAALAAFCAGRSVGGLVLGLPLNMDGSEGPRAQATRAFARNLARVLPLPLTFWDERLSTAAVTRALIGADASRARRAAVVDQLAAAYILQGCLDALPQEDSREEDSREDDPGERLGRPDEAEGPAPEARREPDGL